MFEHAKNPRWTDSSKTKIMLDVKLTGENDYCSFVANPSDCTDYGPMLFNFAVNGVFGQIMLSDEERVLSGELPVPEGFVIQDGKLVNIAVMEQDAEMELQRRFAELQTPESIARSEIDEKYAAQRKKKLAALLAVKEQSGWPLAVVWPEE